MLSEKETVFVPETPPRNTLPPSPSGLHDEGEDLGCLSQVLDFPVPVRKRGARKRKRKRLDADAKDETRTRKTRCGRVSPALLNSRNNDGNANFFIRINLE